MSISLEEFIVKKIALSVEGFSNESIKMMVEEIKGEGLDWITPDAEQSFFACSDRPRYLFIQFNQMKEPQLNWSSCIFTNFKVYSFLDLPLTPLVEEPYQGKRYKVSVFKATHYPDSIYFGMEKEQLPFWLREHDGEEVLLDSNSPNFRLTKWPSSLIYHRHWVEEIDEN